MTNQLHLVLASAILGCLTFAGCDAALSTGKVGNPATQPEPDGTCPAGRSLCETGYGARCLELQTDRENCGTCGHACSPRITCAAGACQQVACTGDLSVSQAEGTLKIPSLITPRREPILVSDNGSGWKDVFSVAYNPGAEPGKRVFQVQVGPAAVGVKDLCILTWVATADGALVPTPDTLANECNEGVTVGDLNGDGKFDLVYPTYYGNGDIKVYLADATGALKDATTYPSHGGATRIDFLDWNGDGSPDLVVSAGTLSLYYNQGDGTFGEAIECGLRTDYPGPVIADFNQDGHPDVAIVTDLGIGVMLNQGACKFLPMAEYVLNEKLSAMAGGDLNGDGHADLVAVSEANTLQLLLGAGDGTFQTAPLTLGEGHLPLKIQTIAVGEATGDGKLDVLVKGEDGPAEILRNTCP